MSWLMKEEDGERKLNIVNLLITLIGSAVIVAGAGWGGREYMDGYCTDQELKEAETRIMTKEEMDIDQLSKQDVELEKAISGLSLQIQQNAVQSRIDWLDAWLADAEKMWPPNPLQNRQCPQQTKADYRKYKRELEALEQKMVTINEKLLK